MYNENIMGKRELTKIIAPFFTKAPELYDHFKNMIGIGNNMSDNTKDILPQAKPHSYNLYNRFLMNNVQPKVDTSSCEQASTSGQL